MQPPPSTPFEELAPPTPVTPLRIVIADDNPVVRAGLTALLSGREDITVVAEAADGREACEAAQRHRPDVVLLDVRMPGVDGLSALPHLVEIAPVMMLTYTGESQIIEEALRRGADGYLVHGEFTVPELIEAIRDIKQGRPHFTPTAAGALLSRLRRDRQAGESAAPMTEDSQQHTDHSLPPLNPANPLSQMQPPVGQSSSRLRFQLSAREAEIMDLIASGMTNQQIAATCFISEKTVKNHINRIFAKLHSTSRAQAAAKWLGVT
ncbi:MULTISPECIES: response regulator [unclassified Streptomyces]|uniref:response regulator n=1 Tax=unclassified Streptomyces TaxID=2593676 RepID=UPI001661CF9A|nr:MULTISPECIES: response regulator transcription factor [unclassified Streptomyces]MBD0843098.1 response regulator transcription factor [Streptomyces sp. TRM68416]